MAHTTAFDPHRKTDWHIDPANVALLIIDMENDVLLPGAHSEVPAAREIVPTINRLAHTCRQAGVPVIWIRHVERKDGSDAGLMWDFLPPMIEGTTGVELYAELDVQPEDHQVQKCRWSALIPGSSNLEGLLRGLKRESLIITGVATNICCESTARDAAMLDYKVFFVSDANATYSQQAHEASLEILRLAFCRVLTSDEVIAELEVPDSLRATA
jgi:ureidoacrylate peracid hydrolase